MPVCPLCGGTLTQWELSDPWRCLNCGARVRGPLPVPDPVEPDEAFL
jgi:tRNA(Ile2) C34 agmatinyltransferase TiaS